MAFLNCIEHRGLQELWRLVARGTFSKRQALVLLVELLELGPDSIVVVDADGKGSCLHDNAIYQN
jgi:hypothetical protein